MSKKPLISVIVPLYNYQKYIGYCIQSILNQTYKHFELIIVDDCSTDNSYKAAKEFKKIDDRIQLMKLDKNYGYSKAKNEGIISSRGDYIVTIDADDMMTKNSLGIRIKEALKKEVSFVYADAIMVYNKISLTECYKLDIDKLKKKKRIPYYASYNASIDIYNIHAQSVLLRRDVHEKYGLYDEKLRSRSDREMWWRLFGKNDKDKKMIKASYVPELVAYYRYHRYSMWRRRKRKPDLDRKIIAMSEKAYRIRKKQGITKENTRFL